MCNAIENSLWEAVCSLAGMVVGGVSEGPGWGAGGTELSLVDVVGGSCDPVAFVVGLRVPGCVPVVAPGERAGEGTLWLTAGCGVPSVAAAGFAGGRCPNVLQAGPRSLWSEVEEVSLVGRPEVFDFGLTVTVRSASSRGSAVPITSVKLRLGVVVAA